MLLIGDIHINAKQDQRIIDACRSFVNASPEEKNIIFVGDYMYMFSYDRQALADLFDFFLELREQGKTLYILAGNHDWLNQHFVYHEGKKIADILNKKADNKIYFITEPATYTIENKEILFMPYNKAFLGNLVKEYQNTSSESLGVTPPLAAISQDVSTLCHSSNYNEQLSGALNMYLLQHFKKDTTLLHHYYTADIRFPGQEALFDYKDIALHPLRTSTRDRIISGHLHKAFQHENYLCIGSMRYTTNTERDQMKWLWQRNTQNDTYKASSILINPYITVKTEGQFDKQTLVKERNQLYEAHSRLLGDALVGEVPELPLANSTLIVYTQQSVEQIETMISDDLKSHIGDVQIKQSTQSGQDMTNLIDLSQYNVQQSLLDWKELVKKYLLSRYGTESEKYRTLLSELNIL